MLYIKNVLLQLRLRLARSLILTIFLLVTGIPLIIGVYLKTTVQGYFDILAEEIGNSIYVWRTGEFDETPFDTTVLAELLMCDHVVGYNQSATCTGLPISFSNTGYENETMYSAEPETEEIQLIGNHDTGFYPSFRTGNMVLVEGEYPSQQSPGVLIDQYLAQENQLALGDSITFWNETQEQEVTATVRGIYQTLQPPKVDYGDYYAIASTSYLFCDWEVTYRQAADYYDIAAPVTIYIDAYQNMSGVLQSFHDILSTYSTDDLEYDCADLVKARSNDESDTGGFLDFQNLLNLILLFLQGVLLVLDMFMVLLWIQDHHQDIGIYRVLGWSRGKIIGTLLCEGLVIFLAAGIPAILIGTVLLHQLGGAIFETFRSIMNGNAGSMAQLNDAIASAISVKTVLRSVGVQGALYVLMILLQVLRTLRMRCTTLLTDQKAL